MRSFSHFIVCLLAVLVLATVSVAGDYSLVRVHFDGQGGAGFLAAHPELDVATVKPGLSADIVTTAKTMTTLRESGFRLEVVHEDLVAHYASRIQNRDTNFGGWHTYSENAAYLDSLRTEYPHLISEKWSIGQTHESRHIWAVRLSDNPDVDESGEPEILLDTMHHAREIMSGEFGIMWADYLCSNYGTDPVVTWLMDNRELYLVSILNPDGVVYNETTDPNGGGMWRKNRRLNSPGVYGVDPNRNYPYEWIGGGSSPDPSSETYRGPSAGSEPEVQALMNLINSHEFVTHQTLHTYGNLTIHPWGYTDIPSPDHAVFQHMGEVMTQFNGYEYGYVGDLLGYDVNGVTFDWSYAGDGHDKIYSVSNEIGTTGFWPSFSERDALFQDNIWPMLYLMKAAGSYAEVVDPGAADTGGGQLDPGDDGLLAMSVVNQGITESIASATVTIQCDDPYIQFADVARNLGSLAPMGEAAIDPFAFTVHPACPDGHLVQVTAECSTAGGGIQYPIAFMVGAPNTIFFDDFTGGTDNWTLSGGPWGLSSTAHSAPSSLTDSPSGDYGNYVDATATINGSYVASELRFWHRFDFEDNYDYGRVQVSADGGAWQTLASYDGTQTAWQEVSLDLSQFSGQSLQVRFLVDTDYSVTEDGWYIDDVMLLGAGSDNETPPTPPLLAPGDGATVDSPVQLVVGNVADPEGDAVNYGFRVYGDAALTQLVASVDGVPVGDAEETAWSASLGTGTYYWRAYAGDSVVWGLLGATRQFTVGSVTSADGVLIGGPRLAVIGQGGSQAELRLSLPQAANLSVKIYNARGMLVRDVFAGRADAGSRTLVWDGRDRADRQVASGIYFVRVETGKEALTGRVLMVR